jgi:hypothetical protein
MKKICWKEIIRNFDKSLLLKSLLIIFW